MSRAGWIAATAAVGLGVGFASIESPVTAAPLVQTTPCSGELVPTKPPLAAPTGLRIIGGGLVTELFEEVSDLWSGPNAGPEEVSEATEASASVTYAYFDQLVQRPDCLIAYSLRSQDQITKYKHPGEVKVNYDPVMDAAKWSWIRDDESAENLRLPILLERPASGTRKILIIADHRWDTGWFTEFKQPDGTWMGGWKWLQVTSGKSATNPEQRVSFEPRMRAIGEWAAEHPNESDVLAIFDVREYMGVRAPTTSTGAVGCGVDFGEAVAINHQMGCFKARANRWTRSFIEIEVTAGDEFAKTSFWLADELQEPVAIFRNAEVRMYNPIREFWYEYDTSRPERLGGAMAAWGRNVVVLKDVADPTTVFARPAK